MRLRYRLGLIELLELNSSHKLQRLKGGVVAALGAVQLLDAGWGLLFPDGQPPRSAFWVSGGAFLLLGLSGPWLAGFGSWALRRAPLIEVEVAASGVTILGADSTEPISWDYFTRWYTTRRLLVLEVGWTEPLAIPRRCCEEAEWGDLLSWVRAGRTKVGAGNG